MLALQLLRLVSSLRSLEGVQLEIFPGRKRSISMTEESQRRKTDNSEIMASGDEAVDSAGRARSSCLTARSFGKFSGLSMEKPFATGREADGGGGGPGGGGGAPPLAEGSAGAGGGGGGGGLGTPESPDGVEDDDGPPELRRWTSSASTSRCITAASNLPDRSSASALSVRYSRQRSRALE